MTPDEIARIYDIGTVLGTNLRKILCPFPDHKHHNYTPSFSIFFSEGKQRFRCFGCGRTGDVIDLVGYLYIPGYQHDDPKHLNTAMNLLTGGKYESTPVIPPAPKATGIYQGEWQFYTPPRTEALEYIEQRGFYGVHEDFRLGQLDKESASYLTIPCFHNDILQGIKLRLIKGEGTRYKSIKGSRGGLFNYDGIKDITGTVFVVKGEIAAMVMEEYGYHACSTTTGESGDMSPYVHLFADNKKVVVIGDNDAHTNSQIKKHTELRARILDAELIYPSIEFKDVDEWILADQGEAIKILDSYL